MKFVHYAIYAFSVLVVGTVVYLIQNGHKGFTNSAFHAKFAAESERSNNDKSWDLDSACNLTEYNDCTPSGRRWTHEKRDTKEQCDILAGKTILFVGDSFVRHAFVATALLLSGDYQKGALKSDHDHICEYGGQFEEKVCRLQLEYTRSVCGGAVALRHKYQAWPTITQQELNEVDYVIWGAGNHPVNLDYSTRYGVLNASIVGSEKLAPTCKYLADSQLQKIFWLDPHARLNSISLPWLATPDEQINRLYRFHTEMPGQLFLHCKIPQARFISPWNATFDLIENFRNDAENMTYDGVHWGMSVNLLKADQIIQAIKESQLQSLSRNTSLK